jgi:hypothetical protein
MEARELVKASCIYSSYILLVILNTFGGNQAEKSLDDRRKRLPERWKLKMME